MLVLGNVEHFKSCTARRTISSGVELFCLSGVQTNHSAINIRQRVHLYVLCMSCMTDALSWISSASVIGHG